VKERLIRWAALPITDRRWAPPLSAVALGFGLFVGVAIGPGASGSVAGGAQVIEVPAPGGGESEETEVEEGSGGSRGAGFQAGGGAPLAEEPFAEEAQATLTPLGGGESPTREPAPAPVPQPPEEEEEGGDPEEPQLAGVVVHVNKAAGSYTVAEEGGVMSAVHAGKPPAAGTKVETPIRTLANGTLAEAGKRKRSGEAESATLAGIVTFVDPNPAAPAYTVSNRGVSVLVRVHPDPTGAPVALPALGAYATVAAEIEKPRPGVSAGGLWQGTLSAGGAPFTHADLEGIVAAVNPEAAQLLISADDVRAGGQDLTLTVPPTIDVSKLLVGESVLAGVDIGADGALTLTGLASDEHSVGADDEAATQGDLVPAKSDKGVSQ
jgi:hypothetical protein